MNERLNKKYPIPTKEEEDVQQALSVLWGQFEQDVRDPVELRRILDEAVRGGVLEELLGKQWVAEKDGVLEMTPQGRDLAKDIVRRHRLSERLLQDVLELPGDQLDPNACRMEHVITRDVEEAICILLGHPRACPHGLPVPQGRCCERSLERTGPIVAPLSSFRDGQEGKIAYLAPAGRPELHRLLSMGLVPGACVRIGQTFPAFVVSVGETILAVDPVLAEHIFVRKKNGK
ncbi:MAG: metal-dependent transcriptional regulator [Elusimicrobia bacterium]|nr:metal-dependent transcriptional regulator [Elusimicrobiota bacterium]